MPKQARNKYNTTAPYSRSGTPCSVLQTLSREPRAECWVRPTPLDSDWRLLGNWRGRRFLGREIHLSVRETALDSYFCPVALGFLSEEVRPAATAAAQRVLIPYCHGAQTLNTAQTRHCCCSVLQAACSSACPSVASASAASASPSAAQKRGRFSSKAMSISPLIHEQSRRSWGQQDYLHGMNGSSPLGPSTPYSVTYSTTSSSMEYSVV